MVSTFFILFKKTVDKSQFMRYNKHIIKQRKKRRKTNEKR